MLNKENKKLMKSLRGPYYKFAKELSSAVFSHNREQNAINETLNDMFSLLANAQADNRDFSDVIPDADKTIHETIACLPIKRLKRLKLLMIVLCAATAVACACAALTLWYISLPPAPALGNLYDISYDNNELLLKWNSVPNAQEYELYVNSDYIATTENTNYPLDLDEGTYDVKITARSEGNFENNPNELQQRINVEYPSVTCGIFDLNQGILLDQSCKKFNIIFTPEFNLYGTVSCEAKIDSIDGKEINQTDNKAEYWFWANKKYKIIVSNVNYYNFHHFTLNICDVTDFPDSDIAAIRKGITLCTLNSSDVSAAFTSKNEDLKFKLCSYDEVRAFIATPSQVGWYNSFCTFANPYVLIQNENNAAVPLDLVPNVITVLPEGETLQLKAGYITFELQENAEFSKSTLFAIFHEFGRIEFVSEDWKGYDADDIMVSYFRIRNGNLYSRYYRGGSKVTLYFQSDSDVQYQCFDPEIEDHVIDLANKTSVTIKQGVNYIRSEDYALITRASGSYSTNNRLYHLYYGLTPLAYENVLKGDYYFFNFSGTEYVYTVQQMTAKPAE